MQFPVYVTSFLNVYRLGILLPRSHLSTQDRVVLRLRGVEIQNIAMHLMQFASQYVPVYKSSVIKAVLAFFIS